MSKKMKKLLEVAQKTKTALFAEWDKKRCFEDYNNFYDTGRGILSESMGLTSVMLLVNRFYENPEVFDQNEIDSKTLDIITTSLDYIYESVFSDGYLVTPLREAEDTSRVINKETSYIDTLTWVLSSSVLITYAIRQGILQPNESMEKKAVELMSDSLARLLNGQLSCGAWGFSTDDNAKNSLYFTYTAAASIADFLDYILGELEYYKNEENQKKNCEEFYDWQTVNDINNYYKSKNNPIYPTEDITVVVAEAKSMLQEWLIKNCLPLLPKISTCTPLDARDMEKIGVANQTSSDIIAKLGDKDYINLYYTFYIIDILTTSSCDKRFPEIINGNDSISIDDLKKSYKNTLSSSDFSYYFEKSNGTNVAYLFDDYINQAVHSARMNFSIAQRTGKAFWDSNASELIITWEHESLSEDVLDEARGDKGFTEPALVPMALRANTVYCFYIIESTDTTVDSLFELICNDRSEKSEQKHKDISVKDLWDSKNYSLPITERSIEALVDYCDYLEVIDTSESNVKSGHVVSSVDDAVQAKIESYIENLGLFEKIQSINDVLNENTVIKLIDDQVNKLLNSKIEGIVNSRLKNLSLSPDAIVSEGSSAPDISGTIGLLEDVQRHFSYKSELPDRDAENPVEQLAYNLLKTFNVLAEKSILESIEDCTEELGKSKTVDVSKKINDQFIELLGAMAKNHNNPAGNIASIYLKNSC